jgi:hypothetical protein
VRDAAIHAARAVRGSGPADVIGCPRCDYDMSGHAAAWERQCPLEAECPECGLTFAWRDVLVEDRRRVPWLFEHARRGRAGLGLLRNAIATFVRLIIPWAFWSRVGLHHWVVVGRLVQWLALIIILHVAVGVLGLGAFALHPIGFRYLTIARKLNLFTEPVVTFVDGWHHGPRGWTSGLTTAPLASLMWRITAAACVVAWIAMILVIPQTRSRAKVQSRHLARAIIYGLSWFAVADLARAVEYAWYALVRAVGGLPTSLHLTATLFGPVGAILLLVWTCAWWHAVLSLGWRIPHPTRTWAMLLVAVLLTGAVVWCLTFVTAYTGW